MKIKGIVMLSVLIACSILAISYTTINKSPKQFKNISLSLVEGFSKDVQKSLLLFIKEQEKMSCSPTVLASLIKETFPSVNKVIIRSGKQNKVHVKVKPYVPLLTVNDSFFLTKSGKLVAVSDYHKSYHLTLPAIIINKKAQESLEISSLCKQFIHHCPTELMKEYTVTWYSPTAVTLQDKKNKKCIVLAHNETELSESLLKHCKQVQQEAVHNNASKHKQCWIDVRFKNQIIIRSEWEELG